MPVSGSVTNATGSVKGISCTGLVDAYTGNWGGLNGTYDTTSPSVGGGTAQVQHVILLSGTAGACAREGVGGGYAPNEVTLRLVFVAYADLPNGVATIPPAADLPLTWSGPMSGGVWKDTSDGAHRELTPRFMKAKSSGGASGYTEATSGTLTLTAADATAYSGSYDPYFGTDHVTGSFTAPWC
jgi:hypothetical protein